MLRISSSSQSPNAIFASALAVIFLTGCVSHAEDTHANSNPVAAVSCQSFNLGDNLQNQLGLKPLQLNLPVARMRNPQQGRSVVLLPASDQSIRVFWARQNKQGQWVMADKQAVVQIQPGRLDASPMHRLYYNAEQQKTVIFVSLPSVYFQKGIALKPILEQKESRWGRIQSYNARLTAQGFQQPFQGVEQGLSGNNFPSHLSAIMNDLEPGSIYIPGIYRTKINLLKPNLVDRGLCPLSESM